MEELKQCSKCKEWKILSEFHRNKTKKNGNSECKECARIQRREYYKNNRKKMIERTRIYQENNKERKAEYNKKYNQENKEKILKQREGYGKKYYQKNRKKILEQGQIYRDNNKENMKEYYQVYYIKNKKKINEYGKSYYIKNKTKIRIRLNKNQNKRYKNDPKYKIRHNVSRLISRYLQRRAASKDKA